MGVIRNGIVALSAICSMCFTVGLAGCAGTEARAGDTEIRAAAAPVVGNWSLDIEHAQRVMRAMFEQRAELVDMPAGTPPEEAEAMRATLVEEWTRQVDQMRMDLVVHADGTFTGRTSTPIRGEVDERSVTGTWSGSGGVFTFEVEGDEPLVVRVRDGALFFSPDRAEGGAEMRLVRN